VFNRSKRDRLASIKNGLTKIDTLNKLYGASYESFLLQKGKPTLARRQAMIHFSYKNVSYDEFSIEKRQPNTCKMVSYG
jgi:hypothetical protein